VWSCLVITRYVARQQISLIGGTTTTSVSSERKRRNLENATICMHTFTLCLNKLVNGFAFQPGGRDPQRGCESVLDGSRIDILSTQLYYICFIRVIHGGLWVILGCFNRSRCKKGWKPLFKTTNFFQRPQSLDQYLLGCWIFNIFPPLFFDKQRESLNSGAIFLHTKCVFTSTAFWSLSCAS